MAYGSKEQKANAEKKAQDIIKKATKAFTTSERQNVESTWSLLAEFILPNANGGFFGDASKGVRKDRRVFSSVGSQANRDLASFLHATITNPAMEWSKLRFRSDVLNNDKDSVTWMQDSIKKVHIAFNESNLNSEIGEGYNSLGALGTMAMFHEEVIGEDGQFEKFNFCTWHLSEIAYAENQIGMVDTIYRKFTMTLKQLYEKFGDTIGTDLMDKLDSSPLEEYHLYHAIYPRGDKEMDKGAEKRIAEGRALPIDRPWASCYVLCKGQKLLKEDGYYEFPVYVPRWSTLPAEIYGYGPGHTALSDIRSLNKVWEEGLKALAKSVNPPIFSTKQNMFTADLRPGKINTVRDVNQVKEFVTQSRLDLLQFAMENLSMTIKSAFYIDKLLLPPRTETGEMTAYEVAQRLEQLQQILGPVVSRFNDELLTPLIMRSIKILQRNGVIAPYPEAVLKVAQQSGTKAIDVEIIFVNSLARSQQMSELRNVQTWLQETAMMAQGLGPEILDKINKDEVIDYMAKIRGIPEQMINSDDDVKAMRDQRNKQMEQQQMLQAGEQVGNIVGKVGPVLNNAQANSQKPPEGK
jgi:hypothetical protein